jgi:hypothetical protein
MRHASGQLAENCRLMSEALREQGFEGSLHEKLLVVWWQLSISAAGRPDFDGLTKMFQGLIDQDEEE